MWVAAGSQLTAWRGGGNPACSPAFRRKPHTTLPWVPFPGSPAPGSPAHSAAVTLASCYQQISLVPSCICHLFPAEPRLLAPGSLSCPVDRSFSHRFPKDFTRPR